MDQKELILKAVEYINDIPSRVDDFLVREKFKKEWGKDFNIYSRYYAGCDPVIPEKKKLPKTKLEFQDFICAYNTQSRFLKEFLEDYED